MEQIEKKTSALKKFIEHRSRRGLKSSNKRSFIVEFFIKADRHFTVEELYDEIKKIHPGISFSTVYRALKLLANCGLATECNFGNAVARFEPVHRAQHHDHLVCQKCGNIIEFKNNEIEKLQRAVAKKYNFSVSSHKLELYGLCKRCRKSKWRR